jgi:tetratricopeptide (TPR) repeat protein
MIFIMIKPQHIDIYLQDVRDILAQDTSEASVLKAIAIYQAAIEHFPEASVEPYLAVGYLAVRSGLDDEAYDLLEKAQRIDPDNANVNALLRFLDQENGISSTPAIQNVLSLRKLNPDLF